MGRKDLIGMGRCVEFALRGEGGRCFHVAYSVERITDRLPRAVLGIGRDGRLRGGVRQGVRESWPGISYFFMKAISSGMGAREVQSTKAEVRKG